MMKLSNETIQILKNFASINANIMFRKGKTITTINSGKNVYGKAEVAEEFPAQCPIYDLHSLLALLTIDEDQDVEFGEKCLTISKGSYKIDYYYAAENVIVAAPEKSVELDTHYEFDISAADINMINKAAAITSAPHINLVAKGGEVNLIVGDIDEPTANLYTKKIGKSNLEFKCVALVENFKMIPDSYKVTLSKKKALHFKNNSKSLEYLLALEKDSEV